MDKQKVDCSGKLKSFVRRKLNAIMITALDVVEGLDINDEEFTVARKKILDTANDCLRDVEEVLPNYTVTQEKYVITIKKENNNG